MKYTFTTVRPLSDEQLAALVEQDGALVVSGQSVIKTQVQVNTEYSDEKVESLRQAVEELQGGPTELTSSEH